MPEPAPRSLYARMGGLDTIRRFVSDFYDRVDKDPVLRPMFVEETMEGPKERLVLFLCMYFGGPLDFLLERGPPALPFRHAPFVIGPRERDAWVAHMDAAIDALDLDEELRSQMKTPLARTATFLINTPESPGISPEV